MTGVALIPLYWRGHHVTDALVDEDDWPALARYRWSTAPVHLQTREMGYATASIDGKLTKMDRRVMGLVHGDRRVAHHRNQVKFDNRKQNLQVFESEHLHQMCGEHTASMLDRLRLGQGLVQETRKAAGLEPLRFLRHRDTVEARGERMIRRRLAA